MKTISVTKLAQILDLKYSQVDYYCRKYHFIGRIKVGNRVYYHVEYAKAVAETLIILSDKELDEVIQELYQY